MTCEPVLAENSDTEVYETTIIILEEIWQEWGHFNNESSSIHGALCRLNMSAMMDYISVSCLLE